MPTTTRIPIALSISPLAMDFAAELQAVFPSSAGPLAYMVDRIGDGHLAALLEKTAPLDGEFPNTRLFLRGSIGLVLVVDYRPGDDEARVLVASMNLLDWEGYRD